MAESNYLPPWARELIAAQQAQPDARPWCDVLVTFSDGTRRFVPRESISIKMERVDAHVSAAPVAPEEAALEAWRQLTSKDWRNSLPRLGCADEPTAEEGDR